MLVEESKTAHDSGANEGNMSVNCDRDRYVRFKCDKDFAQLSTLKRKKAQRIQHTGQTFGMVTAAPSVQSNTFCMVYLSRESQHKHFTLSYCQYSHRAC